MKFQRIKNNHKLYLKKKIKSQFMKVKIDTSTTTKHHPNATTIKTKHHHQNSAQTSPSKPSNH